LSGKNKFLSDIRIYAKENNVPIIYEDGIEKIEEYINENNVLTILEIGCAIGYSSIRMAMQDENIKITTVEISEEMVTKATANIKEAGLDNQIEVILCDGLDFETNQKYDLIFIDAAKSQYIRFFDKFKENLNSDGAIISDNLDFHGYVKQEERIESKNLRQLINKIRKYIAFLEDNNEFDTRFFDLGDGIAISKRVKKWS